MNIANLVSMAEVQKSFYEQDGSSLLPQRP
jgi:hypothetical protein